MKYLILSLLFVIASCGKDNKSGNLAVPSPFNPQLSPQQEFLVGHWVEQDGCRSDEKLERRFRGRNTLLRVRYEMRFYPTNGRYDSMAKGYVSYGGVEYSGRCERNTMLDDAPKKQIYVVSPKGLKLPTRSGRLGDFQVKVLSSDTIEFKGMTLVRVSNNPHL